MFRYVVFGCALFSTGVVAETCALKLDKNDYTFKTQTHTLNKNITIDYNQWVKTLDSNEHKARVAINVSCQHMLGMAFTGNANEWQGFYRSALNGLLAAKAKDIQFTLIGEDRALYKGKADNYKEYRFDANLGGNQQVIKNFTVLDLDKNEVITVSISGNEIVEDEIKAQYKKILNELAL